ncbi:hypothetical protein RN22_20690 [Grimontia sp. AD028]|uniref:hypothetical protein n=1 Tax=Grimontia sp. AD028 TaxID=1581149 RepID=UPI00061B4F50|nr:hypothetical protein [Grimontia sp. AD028]KKD58535.1 hypothetical protein RN22_20690 [Grimontia sp. AD028]
MTIQKVNIQQAFYDVLMRESFDKFTALQLRDAVGKRPSEDKDEAELRKLVYRTLNRLTHKGLLLKKEPIAGKKPQYHKTEAFKDAHWHILDKVTTEEVTDSSASTNDWLASRLEQCESDFIACLSEFETYKDLCEQAPYLNAKLQDVRTRTREQSSKLLGEIRALKIALSLS